MKKKKSGLVNLFAALGMLLGVIGLIMSFLPVRMFAIFPAVAALLLGAIAYFIANKQQAKKTFAIAVLAISVASLLIALFSEMIFSSEVEEDLQFEEVIESSTEEAEEDIMEALEDIDLEGEMIEEEISEEELEDEIIEEN